MASNVENSVEIDRPVSQVFEFVDDYENTTKYLVGMTQYKPTTKQTNGEGARFNLVKKTSGLPDIKSEIEITRWQKDKLIAFESISGFENGGSYTFTAKGDRTTVKLANSYDLTSLLGGGGGLFGGLKKAAGGAASKIAEGQARKDLTTSLETLKRLVEATPVKKTTAAARPTAGAAKKPVAKKPAAKKATATKPTAKKATAKKATASRSKTAK
jgi:uncharacterized protein YndB with AHSA1/START domain